MSAAIVQKALNPIIESIGLDVAWPNISFDPQNLDATCKIYLQVFYLWSQSENQTLACGRQPGILQINVCTRDGLGSIEGAIVVDQLTQMFERDSAFNHEETEVRIDKEPWPGNGFIDSGWWVTPVNIPFEVDV